MIKKIISGGQTGADRMGLEVGKKLGLETGGTAPVGFITEDGPDFKLRDEFGLTEITPGEKYVYERKLDRHDRYSARTAMNARFSDGTVCFSSNKGSGGTRLTRQVCEMFGKPFILNPNIDSLKQFIIENKIEALNVAGNRASRMNRNDAARFRTVFEEAIRQLLTVD